ncbi:MAG: DUF1460 domain-containing protein [Rhodothermales bacterium]|nr:DUF1460 domain-containing protein [Rhodothermales bacterium]
MLRPSFVFVVVLMPGILAAGCQQESAPVTGASLPVVQVAAIAPPDSATARRFETAMAFARANRLSEKPIGEIMQALGETLVETPYEAGTLDRNEEETLVVGFMGFDCVTFVESMLAMARGIRDEAYNYASFARHLTEQRYRDGQLEGYCSRLHYFSEWIEDNGRRRIVAPLTESLGGIPLEKSLTFMSEHRASYPQLVRSDSLFGELRTIEGRLQSLRLTYIPQERIHEVYERLQAGDIVALATDIEGLDVAHTGLVYAFGDGRIGLLHASTSAGVTVSPDLQSYVENNRRQIGIVVARPL